MLIGLTVVEGTTRAHHAPSRCVPCVKATSRPTNNAPTGRHTARVSMRCTKIKTKNTACCIDQLRARSSRIRAALKPFALSSDIDLTPELVPSTMVSSVRRYAELVCER
jgi:hypothetical protein